VSASQFRLRLIVRGYISGVTKTSIWYSYSKGETRHLRTAISRRTQEKIKKLEKNRSSHQRHMEVGAGGHDERLTREEIIERKIVPQKTLRANGSGHLLALCAWKQNCEKKAAWFLLIPSTNLVCVMGKLTLIDEIHTPRFFTILESRNVYFTIQKRTGTRKLW